MTEQNESECIKAALESLNPRQRRFVEEYLIDLNAAKAYGRAGYRAHGASADAAAWRLLRNVKVAAAIREAQQARSTQTGIKSSQVLEEISHVAFSDIGDVLDFSGPNLKVRPASEIPEHARRAIASMKVHRKIEGTGDNAREVEVTEIKFWNKLGALDQAGRHLGLFDDAQDSVTVNVENKVKLDARTLFDDVEEYLPVFERIAQEKILARLADSQRGGATGNDTI
ncbi:MAG: terminase small subunit [Planctomycetes bacterium]|nr:terminase small subunit [Planctomycetota bacterium]